MFLLLILFDHTRRTIIFGWCHVPCNSIEYRYCTTAAGLYLIGEWWEPTWTNHRPTTGPRWRETSEKGKKWKESGASSARGGISTNRYWGIPLWSDSSLPCKQVSDHPRWHASKWNLTQYHYHKSTAYRLVLITSSADNTCIESKRDQVYHQVKNN